MDNKYQENQNSDKENKYNKTQDTYRNDSELTNKNGYMIYELNNTFNDKNKDVFNGSVDDKLNNSKNIYNKSENKKNENKNK